MYLLSTSKCIRSHQRQLELVLVLIRCKWLTACCRWLMRLMMTCWFPGWQRPLGCFQLECQHRHILLLQRKWLLEQRAWWLSSVLKLKLMGILNRYASHQTNHFRWASHRTKHLTTCLLKYNSIIKTKPHEEIHTFLYFVLDFKRFNREKLHSPVVYPPHPLYPYPPHPR